MGSEVCVDVSCGSSSAHEWKKGWPLPYGGFAQYCNNCGISTQCKLDSPDSISPYEAFNFCRKFHREEPGWRDCGICNKPIHSGCIVSRYLFDYLDFGGIGCISCLKASQLHLNTKEPNGAVTSTKHASYYHPFQIDAKRLVDSVEEGKLLQLGRTVKANDTNGLHHPRRDKMISSSCGSKSQDIMCITRDMDSGFSNMNTPSIPSLKFAVLENSRPTWEIQNMREPFSQPSSAMSLGSPSGNSAPASSTSKIVDGRLESNSSSLFHQGQRSHPVFANPPKTGPSLSIETDRGRNSIPKARIGRPPLEGRGKAHLLPRYWPRYTDEEVKQLSGHLKSIVVPLFEKVLSASDAGRIGRLVLPKACAEAFFPTILQSEGVPLEILDVKGNVWVFQFRYWPNNNSRMYVLEGVTPCIQGMDLVAGDTVTFSRIDPEGKLIMGFRKTSGSLAPKNASASGHSNGMTIREASICDATENLPSGSGYSDLRQTMEGNREPHLHLGNREADFCQMENHGQLSDSVSDKNTTRNIGPKNKRLLINSADALELSITWEEAQGLLRPPPSVEPIVVTIEDQIFEEYNVPPVFGKRTIFSACSSGGHEQWASCDECHKWRKLPVDVLLPPKWTCSENVWDPNRSCCSAPEELEPKELEDLLKSTKVLGDNRLWNPCDSSPAELTTKHPKHRAGCTCIVCIQPPSGRRHHPNCTCNVCLTVKRRLGTLMQRRKKRQFAHLANANQMMDHHREESDMKGALFCREDTSRHHHVEKEEEGIIKRRKLEAGESSTVQIDLNSHPDRDDMQVDGPSMINYPSVPVYMDQNGPIGGQGCFGSGMREKERTEDKAYYDPNSSQNNPS